MAISNAYPKGAPVEDFDLFVGTKAFSNRTVNYTSQGIADYLNINAKVSIGGQLSFKFTIVPNVPKTIAFDGGFGDGTAFSAINELIVSAIDVSSNNITVFLNYLNNSKILLSQQNQPNFFGHYKIIGYTQIGLTDFYKLDLEFIGGNGTIGDEQYYDLVSFVLTSADPVVTPNLQEVTDVGSVTTNTISALGFSSNDGFGNSFSLSGAYFDMYDVTGAYFTNFGSASSLFLTDVAGNSFSVNANVIDLVNPLGTSVNISSSGMSLFDNILVNAWTLNYPVKPNGYVGTFAMLDDLPAGQDLQSVTTLGANTNIAITVEDAALPLQTYSRLSKGGLYVYTSGEQSSLSHAQLSLQRGGTVINNLLIEPGGGSRNCNFYLPIKANGDYVLATMNDIPSVSGFVPYTGANSNVNLGVYGLTSEFLQLNTTPTTYTPSIGKIGWNDTDGTLEFQLKGGNVTLQIGQEQVIRVVNKTVPLINLLEANYQVCLIAGAQGQRVSVRLAQADNDANSAGTLGIVTETISANQEGFITTSGQVKKINTTGSLQGETWADGDILYLSPTTAGAITNIKPIAPAHTVIVGYVEYAHAINGKIFVKIDNGYELDELHNVLINTPLNNQALVYETATTLWKNKTIIDDSITNGVTDRAPSQNAVFDALALKQDKFIQNASVTLIVSGWSLVGSYYEYTYTDANIAATSFINFTPNNASNLGVTSCKMLPQIDAAVGSCKFYAMFPPQTDIVGQLIIQI